MLSKFFGRNPKQQNQHRLITRSESEAKPIAYVSASIATPLWKQRGLDHGLLKETITGLEDLTLFSIGYPADYESLISYADDNNLDRASNIIKHLWRTNNTNARDYILEIDEKWNSSDLDAEFEKWLWTYALTDHDLECFSKLEERKVVLSRDLLNQYLDFKTNIATFQYIYVMVEEATEPSICKIGRTNLSPEIREKQLNASTSQHRRIILYCSWKVKDSVYSESMIHGILDECRVAANREFFQIEPRRAEFLIERILTDFNQLL